MTINAKPEFWKPILFGLIACSWMPHWACHYYRLETESTFVVGNWNFSLLDSVLSILVYSTLIAVNLIAISVLRLRFVGALASGILHLTLGIVHIIRLIHPFVFTVFRYDWSTNSSVREILLVIPFGIVCIVIAIKTRTK